MSTTALKMTVLAALVFGTEGASLAQTRTNSGVGPTNAQESAARELRKSGVRVGSGRSDFLIPGAHERAPGTSVHQFLSRKRPSWLHPRGATLSPAGPQVVVVLDGFAMGGVAELRDLPLSMVAKIQRLSGPDATTRFGTGFGAGAILLTTF